MKSICGAIASIFNTHATTWEIPQEITEITQNYIQGTMPWGTTRVIIPAGVTSIGEATFEDCTGLTQINLPEGLTSIGDKAFWYCTGLTQINLPAGLTSIGEAAFRGCRGLTQIKLPEGVTSIGEAAFEDCTGLTQINLPEGLTSIGEEAFRNCTGLTQINLLEGVTSIGDAAFASCTGLTQINLPEGLTSIGRNAFRACTGLTQIVIPEGSQLTSIGVEAFQYCRRLTQINLPAGLTSIGNSAFLNCTGLTQIHLPEGVTSIGNDAFWNCTGLTQMILPDQFCTDAAKVRLRIPEAVRCIGYGEIQRLNIEGAYPIIKQALLYRLSSDRTFHPDELKGLKDCSFHDVMKAIQSRYTTLGAEGDIPGLNGLFGRPRIDQAVAVAKLNLAQTVSAMPEDLTSTLLSYMTVKDVMKYSQYKRGGSGLLSQSLFKPQEAGGHGAEQAGDKTASGTGPRP